MQFFVDYVNSGNVSAYGPGLIHGTVNKPAVFTVDTKDAGEGGRRMPTSSVTLSSALESTHHALVFLQVVCLWPSRGRPRRISAVWTTRTGRAPYPTCLCCLETTASWSNTTTSTSQEAPFLPGLLVPVHLSFCPSRTCPPVLSVLVVPVCPSRTSPVCPSRTRPSILSIPV